MTANAARVQQIIAEYRQQIIEEIDRLFKRAVAWDVTRHDIAQLMVQREQAAYDAGYEAGGQS